MMNERIKELIEKSNWYKDDDYIVSPEEIEKFAELIVRECVNICKQGNDTQMSSGGAADAIKYHFGVK